MANFLSFVIFAGFLPEYFIAFFCGIELYENHLILIPLGRFLAVLIFLVTESICTFFFEFLFLLAIVDLDG